MSKQIEAPLVMKIVRRMAEFRGRRMKSLIADPELVMADEPPDGCSRADEARALIEIVRDHDRRTDPEQTP